MAKKKEELKPKKDETKAKKAVIKDIANEIAQLVQDTSGYHTKPDAFEMIIKKYM
jgi:hypothetical protein